MRYYVSVISMRYLLLLQYYVSIIVKKGGDFEEFSSKFADSHQKDDKHVTYYQSEMLTIFRVIPARSIKTERKKLFVALVSFGTRKTNLSTDKNKNKPSYTAGSLS